jgi:hypothetical protein
MPPVPGRERSDTFKPTKHRRISLHLNTTAPGLSLLYARLNALLGKNFSSAFPGQRVRTLFGRNMQSNIHSWHSAGGTHLTAQDDIASTIASKFSSVSTCSNYDPRFRAIKRSAEATHLTFSSRVAEEYNYPFSTDELTASLERPDNTSPGPDRIHNNHMLLHLPPAGRSFRCSCINIWAASSVPVAWREAVFPPIMKPEKEHSLASNYRQVSLTSCLCKTMKRMVKRSLVWVLESKNLLSNAQCRFRRHNSTFNHLVNL